MKYSVFIIFIMALSVSVTALAADYNYDNIGMRNKKPDLRMMDENCGEAFPGEGGCGGDDPRSYKSPGNKVNREIDKPQVDRSFKPGIRQPSGIQKPQKAFGG